MATLLDFYSESNVDSTDNLINNGVFEDGQSFTTPNDGNLYSLDSGVFYITKTLTPTGNIYAKLYTHSGTYGNGQPTGSALATSNPIDITTLSVSLSLVVFTFSGANRITLSTNTHYFITIACEGDVGPGALEVGYDGSSPTAPGNVVRSTDGSSWSVFTTWDLAFYVYGVQIIQPNVFDTITTSENISKISFLSISVSDTVTTSETTSIGKTPLKWKGFLWDLRDQGGTGFPGYGGWSSANVSDPDVNNYVTIKVTNPTGAFPFGMEMDNRTQGLGYGIYTLVISGEMDTFNKNIVFGGLFPYYGGTPFIEFDTGEVSMWDHADADAWGPNVVYMSQNSWYNGGSSRSHTSAPIDSGNLHTSVFTWAPGMATFDYYEGVGTGGTNLSHFVVSSNVPVPSTEICVINFWVFTVNGSPDAGDLAAPNTTLILRDFNFTVPINVFETLTTSESVTVVVANYNLSVFDTVTTNEVETTLITIYTLSISSLITISETEITAFSGTVNKIDMLTTSESVTTSASLGGVSISDLLTTSESVTVFSFTATPAINVFETLTISESLPITLISGTIFLFDIVTTNESKTIVITGVESVSVFDILTTHENLVYFGILSISVIDILTLSDNFQSGGTSISFFVFDTITTSETLGFENFKFSPDIPGKIVGTLLKSV